jgi:hypothetical protein
MTVALIRTESDGADERGRFASEADARKWLDTVETMIDRAAVAAGLYSVIPVEVDYPHLVVTVEIENTYELYGDITTVAENIVIPVPPEQDSDDFDEWFHDHIVPWSGCGRPDGDSWYDFEITASSDEAVLPVGTTYDWGY